MKKLFSKLILLVALLTLSHNAMAERKIGIIDFKAGVGIMQSDVDGISAIFTTYFSPQNYVLVERTQIEQIIEEQGFQRTKLTQREMVRIGRILNLQYIVVGDVNVVSGLYNLDARVVDVESGSIIAKDGASWEKGTSYRTLMRDVATRLATNMPIIEEKPIVTPIDTVVIVKKDTVIRKERKPRKVLKPITPGYEQSIEGYGGINGAINGGGGISYIGGYRLNNTLFLGAGIGINFEDTRGTSKFYEYGINEPAGRGFRVSIPLYLHLRTYFTATKWQPFFAFSIGAKFSTSETLIIDFPPYYINYEYKFGTCGFIFSPALGLNCRLNDNLGMYIKVAYDAQTYPHTASRNEFLDDKIVIRHKLCHGFNTGIGFTF